MTENLTNAMRHLPNAMRHSPVSIRQKRHQILRAKNWCVKIDEIDPLLLLFLLSLNLDLLK